jgi:hypothetical protein
LCAFDARFPFKHLSSRLQRGKKKHRTRRIYLAPISIVSPPPLSPCCIKTSACG